METEMHNAENTPDIRSLSDAELDDVSGGYAALVVGAAFIIAFGAELAIGFGDLPFGKTKQDAANALGVGYLL
jgi:hypothetical protein